jgi:tetratricopeptide (TPR) repeat protein
MAKSSPSTYSSVLAAPAPRLVRRAELVAQRPSLAHLWQMPALLLSLGLFTLAAYLFIGPQPAQSLQRQLAVAQRDIDAQRYDAAIGRLNDLLVSPLEPAAAAQTRLLIAEALDRQVQRNRRQDTPQVHRRIIAEINAAYAGGLAATTITSDRLARSHEALGDVDEASANYRRGVELAEQDGKPEQAVPMRRSQIELLIAHNQPVSAQAALQQFLDVPGLTDDERAWALGEMARIHIDADRPAEAQNLLAAAAALSPDDAIRGQVSYRLGYAAWKLGVHQEAEAHLLRAREQLGPGHFLEPDACYLLGRIAQDRRQFVEAEAFYQLVLRDHPDSRVAPRAQLAAGMVKVLTADDERGADQLAALADEVARKPALSPLQQEVISSLQRAGRILASRGHHQLAMDLMDREQALLDHIPAEFLERRAATFELLLGAAEASLAELAADAPDRTAAENRTRDLRRQAGEAYAAAAMLLKREGDVRYADALWKGIAFLEVEPDPARVIAALEAFAVENPQDPQMPVLLLRLGLARRAAGEGTSAIEAFRKLRTDYPQSDSALSAAVPLAQALMERGEPQFPEAREALRSVVDLAAAPAEVRSEALWELGRLSYRMEDYDEALSALERLARVSPVGDNPRPQMTFLMADCLRRKALARLADARQPPDPLRPDAAEPQLAASAEAAVEDPEIQRVLEAAGDKFDQVIEQYRNSPAATPLDENYERLAWFHRAGCLFDLGRYEQAIEQYTAAARRYGDDPASLAAYIQIANACTELGRPREAKLARERAMWLLKRLPPDVLSSGRFTLSRDYWEQWLDAAGELDAG